MDLLTRARAYIEAGNATDGASLLRDCLADGGVQALAAVQLLAEDMYGGETFNFELKAPPALALLRWGEQGLDALVEMATRSPTSKNISICLSLYPFTRSLADRGIALCGSILRVMTRIRCTSRFWPPSPWVRAVA